MQPGSLALHRLEDVRLHRLLVDLADDPHGRRLIGLGPPIAIRRAGDRDRLNFPDPSEAQPFADDGRQACRIEQRLAAGGDDLPEVLAQRVIGVEVALRSLVNANARPDRLTETLTV